MKVSKKPFVGWKWFGWNYWKKILILILPAIISTFSYLLVQNIEKQKVRLLYGLKEKQFYNLFGRVKKKKGNAGDNLLISCESRLDNLIFRSGIVNTRRLARQLVSHGHFLIDGQKINVPSYQMKPEQIINLRKENMAENKLIKSSLEQNAKVPPYITFDRKKLIITYLRYPTTEEFNKGINIDLVVEWYNRKM